MKQTLADVDAPEDICGLSLSVTAWGHAYGHPLRSLGSPWLQWNPPFLSPRRQMGLSSVNELNVGSGGEHANTLIPSAVRFTLEGEGGEGGFQMHAAVTRCVVNTD